MRTTSPPATHALVLRKPMNTRLCLAWPYEFKASDSQQLRAKPETRMQTADCRCNAAVLFDFSATSDAPDTARRNSYRRWFSSRSNRPLVPSEIEIRIFAECRASNKHLKRMVTDINFCYPEVTSSNANAAFCPACRLSRQMCCQPISGSALGAKLFATAMASKNEQRPCGGTTQLYGDNATLEWPSHTMIVTLKLRGRITISAKRC